MNRTKNLMLMRANMLRKLNVSRHIIEDALGVNSYAEFETFAASEFDNFSDTLPFFKDRNNQANFSYGPLLLATYRTLVRKYDRTDAQAIEAVRQIVDHVSRHKIEHMNFILKIFFKKMGKWQFLNKTLENYFKYRPETMGWQAILHKEKDAYVAADMTTCGLFQWLIVNDTPQICSLACDSDFVTMEYIPHLKLERKKTIAMGDPICSFRYIQI